MSRKILAPGTGVICFKVKDPAKKNQPDLTVVVCDADGTLRRYAGWVATYRTGVPRRDKNGNRYYRLRQSLMRPPVREDNPFERLQQQYGGKDETDEEAD